MEKYGRFSRMEATGRERTPKIKGEKRNGLSERAGSNQNSFREVSGLPEIFGGYGEGGENDRVFQGGAIHLSGNFGHVPALAGCEGIFAGRPRSAVSPLSAFPVCRYDDKKRREFPAFLPRRKAAKGAEGAFSGGIFDDGLFDERDDRVHARRQNAEDKDRRHHEVQLEHLAAVDDEVADARLGDHIFAHDRALSTPCRR